MLHFYSNNVAKPEPEPLPMGSGSIFRLSNKIGTYPSGLQFLIK